MEKEIYRVEPIIYHPECMRLTGKQNDCRLCGNKEKCMEENPRAMCIRPYKNHPNGCPNFGVLKTCPPIIPCLYDDLFDLETVYAVVTRFDLTSFFDARRERSPHLPEGQIRNQRIWQPITKKENDYGIAEFYKEHPECVDYVATRLLECMGVDVIKTMKKAGLDLKFPVKDFVYRVAFVAKAYYDVLEEYGFTVREEKAKEKRGVRTLVLK